MTTRETILRVGRLFGQTGAGFVAGLLLLAGAVLVGTGRVRYPLSIAKAVVQWVARRAMWHGQHGARTVQLLAHVFTRGAFPYPDDIPMQPPQ